jgi:hypothetical protein
VELNRRQFGKTALTAAGIVMVAPATLLRSCSTSISGLVNAVISSAEAILTIAEPGASWIPTLTAAVTMLKDAETKWKSGGAVTILLDAINVVQTVLGYIPVTAPYAALISIAIAGVEAVIAALPTSLKMRVTLESNPYVGKVQLRKPHILQTQVGAYKAQFNDVAKGLGYSVRI